MNLAHPGGFVDFPAETGSPTIRLPGYSPFNDCPERKKQEQSVTCAGFDAGFRNNGGHRQCLGFVSGCEVDLKNQLRFLRSCFDHFVI